MNRLFWKGKKVLVTGCTGFKGSWLSLWLQSLESHVVGYSLLPHTEPSLFELANVENGMVYIPGDVRDLEHIKSVMEKYQPEIVIHMAAQALVHSSYLDPVETYSTNIMGTVNILEAVRHSNSVRVVVSITSDKCYENKEWLWGYRENERMGGHDPYSSSKGCAELVVSAYRTSYFSIEKYAQHGIAVGSARAGNVIGGGDWSKDRLVPDILNAFMKDQPVIIRNPSSTRPWQFVMTPLSGYLILAEQLWSRGPGFAESWNFGPNDDDVKPVSWIVEYMSNLWGDGACFEIDSVVHPHEDNLLKLDCSKAKSLLKWTPKLTLATTLEWIVEWYQAYRQNKNIRQFTESQIKIYESY